MKNFLAIGFIWLGCAIAWVILGATVVSRTGESSAVLNSEVQGLWGPPRTQLPPSAVYREVRNVRETVTNYDSQGRPVVGQVEREQWVEAPILLDGSAIDVGLSLEYRRKGLLWFPTYEVDFRAHYSFLNDTTERRRVEMRFPLEAGNTVYDGFEVRDPSGKPVATVIKDRIVGWSEEFGPGEKRDYSVAYRSRGTATWHYGEYSQGFTGEAGRAVHFSLAMKTNFTKVDFPSGTLSPSRHEPTAAGWAGGWSFDSIVTSVPIGVDLPQRLNPGPLASRITFFAPVGLLFFFFVVAVLAAARRKAIHPMNYFFFGCAFFAFHLLFAYLVDHVAIGAAFAVSSSVSILLVVTYARLFVGWRFALVQMALAQLIYLVLFSFTFLWEGFTGLAITVGAILTLFVMMQITGRLGWRENAGTRP